MTRNDLKTAVRTTLAWDLLGDLGNYEEGENELLDLLERVYNKALGDAKQEIEPYYGDEDIQKALERLKIK